MLILLCGLAPISIFGSVPLLLGIPRAVHSPHFLFDRHTDIKGTSAASMYIVLVRKYERVPVMQC